MKKYSHPPEASLAVVLPLLAWVEIQRIFRNKFLLPNSVIFGGRGNDRIKLGRVKSFVFGNVIFYRPRILFYGR